MGRSLVEGAIPKGRSLLARGPRCPQGFLKVSRPIPKGSFGNTYAPARTSPETDAGGRLTQATGPGVRCLRSLAQHEPVRVHQ